MERLLKFTYLLDSDGVKKELDKLWSKYQKILADPNWEDLNEARGILYSTGNLFCETVAVGAIEHRLHLLKKPLDLVTFLSIIDSNSPELPNLRKDKMFAKLEKFYVVVKNYKNNDLGGCYYLDEEKFIKLYNKYAPNKLNQIGYRGRFGKLK